MMYIYNDADYDVHCIVMQTMLETAMQYGRHSVSQFASTVRRKVITLRRKLITLRRKLITLRRKVITLQRKVIITLRIKL